MNHSSRTPLTNMIHPEELTTPLRRWYRAHRRSLPWRETRDPYRIWVSEVMLQQTRVSIALPYYNRFLERLPTLEHLAVAPEEEVLGLWSGLGYYRRGRDLHRAAKVVMERHGGRFPKELDEAVALPGVGHYTAAAILSIAYDLPHAALDGNAMRVFARLFGVEEPIDRPSTRTRLECLESSFLSRRGSGELNQAWMELGARVCLPRNPLCLFCPITSGCVARKLGIQNDLPKRRRKTSGRLVRWHSLVVEGQGRFLLRRRPHGSLLAGFWELPTIEDEGRNLNTREVAETAGSEWDLPVRRLYRVGSVRHTITFRNITVHLYATELMNGRPPRRKGWRWVVLPREVTSLPHSSLLEKLLRAYESSR